MSNENKSNSIVIGAAWQRTKSNDKGPYTFISLAMTGKREQDVYEVILRRKEDGAELPLAETPVILVGNSFKKENSKHPDYFLRAFIDSEESTETQE